MDAPAERALAFVEKIDVAHQALSAHADRMAELDAKRRTLVLDILAFEERRDAAEYENRRNDRWENTKDLWAEESFDLTRGEEALETRIETLAAAKDHAQNECVNAIGDLWGPSTTTATGKST